MIRWAERNKDQRVMVGKDVVIQNPKSDKPWQTDFTEVLKLTDGMETWDRFLSKEEKCILNKMWNTYK